MKATIANKLIIVFLGLALTTAIVITTLTR